MRILDADHQGPMRRVQLYLTPPEAADLRDALDRLARDPEAGDHEHVQGEEGSRELSVSLVTPAKLRDLSRYSDAERRMFAEP